MGPTRACFRRALIGQTDETQEQNRLGFVVGVSDDHETVAACEKVGQQELGHQVSAARSQPYGRDAPCG